MNKDVLKLIKGSVLFKRFLILFAVLATLPVLVLGVVSLYLVDSAHKQDVSALETQLINQKTEEIDKFFIDTTGVLEISTRPENFNEYSIQVGFLRGVLSSSRTLTKASFVDMNGFRTAHMSKEGGVVREVSAVGNFSDNPGFLSAVEDKTYVGKPKYTDSGVFVDIWAPVRRFDPDRNEVVFNDPLAIVYAEASLSDVLSAIESASLGNSGYLILIDQDGRAMAEGAPFNIERGADVSHLNRVKKVLAGTVFTGLDEEDRYNSFFSGEDVVGAGRIVPGTGWVLLVEWPVSDADAVIQDVRNRVLQLLLAALFAVLLIAPFFAARLVRPMRKLQFAAGEIEKGKFDTGVIIHTGDEMEELGATFNDMAKGLKRLQELKDEFVFVAAHELRTPVTAIKGYLSLILEGSAGQISAQAKKFLEQTQRSNDRLNQLVNDLLEIARSEAGRLEIHVSATDIEEPVRGTIDELRPLADAKQMSLSYRALEVMPKVMSEAGRVKEVLVNLIGNSIKYTQEGGSIEIYHEQKDGMLVTHVKDNGFGISKEAQEKLFEKFYRVQTEKTKTIQGTGLGLFIVKQIIEKMGGKIWVTSEEGKGSIFSFSLPLAGSYSGGDVK